MEVLMSGNENVPAMMYMMSDATLEPPQSPEQFQAFGARLRAEFESDGVRLKASMYNYRHETSRGVMIYNTLYNSMARLTADECDVLDGLSEGERGLRIELLSMGFAVLAGIDERASYARWRRYALQNLQHLSVNMTTTLKCNARCAYCYEHGVTQVDFDESKLEALTSFIKRRKREMPVALNWFGGEPLLNPKVIDYVTGRLVEQGIEFNSYMITNGSLLTRRLIEKKFPQWRMRGIQITLDGTEHAYEARKNYVGNGRHMFKRVLERIEWAASSGVMLDIRLNIERNNFADVLDLIYLLQSRFDGEKNVVYYPAFLTGIGDKLTDEEKVSFIKQMFRALANPNKFSITNRLYSMPRSMPCMRCDPQSFSVDVYGRVYNCEHLVGRKAGSLGTVKRLSKARNESRLEYRLRAECEECVFLPKCLGGCESDLRTGDAACLIERYIIPAYVEYLCE